MKRDWKSPRGQFIQALALASIASIGLFLYGAAKNSDFAYNYLVWNLFLAWLPLLFAVRLMTVLHSKLWSSWEALGMTALWLLFLPNSFYMISDYIHIQELTRVDILFDVVMFSSFIFTGVVLGFCSLYLIHLQLRSRFNDITTSILIAGILLLCSAAIFIGRDLRWNSWDILTNPGGLLFDVSNRIQNLADYPQMLLTIITFFILLSTMYLLLWRGANLLIKTEGTTR